MVSTVFSSIIRSRGPWRDRETTRPSSQHRTVTLSCAYTSDPTRSGSPTHGSIPAVTSSSARSGRRVVPRTAWPSSSSERARAAPRQPQPTIRTRATPLFEGRPELFLGDLGLALGPAALVLEREQLVDLLALEPGLAARVELALLGGDIRPQLALGELGLAAAPAALVGGLEHLVDVVELVLDLRLERGVVRLPIEHVRSRSGIEAPEQQHEDDDHRHSAEDDDDERVHSRSREYSRARCRTGASARSAGVSC